MRTLLLLTMLLGGCNYRGLESSDPTERGLVALGICIIIHGVITRFPD